MGKHETIPDKAQANRDRVAKWRASMRAQGLRPKQLWLPDTKDPAWREEARRQSRLAAESEHAADDQAFVDSITDWEGMPPP
jgi:surfactin synthase thioesterase subunit